MTEKTKKQEIKKNKAEIETSDCKDKCCPKHGNISLRGRSFYGTVIRKFPKRIAIEFERTLYVKKYERYSKRKTRIHARLPDCIFNEINLGDYIEVKETRPISKLINFVVVGKVMKEQGGKETMKAVAARLTRGLNIGSKVFASDNSGARIVKIVGVVGGKSTKGRQQYAKVGDRVKISVRKGDTKMKGLVFDAVVIRQKKPYRRNTGERVAFMDNAVALLKDEKGNPKGTQIKGPIAKEAAERWQFLSKIAKYVL